ncbi:MAG: DUF1015 domain-containing protein, partial [Bacteroidia bacterium]|nr:DUF1015 domain-containing protein [Bacteroidia bacterium]
MSLKAFYGWVYREEPRVAPVVDAILPSQVEKLRLDPYQAIHLSLPERNECLPQLWEDWIKRRVVVSEPLPTLYAYSQTFYQYGERPQAYQR